MLHSSGTTNTGADGGGGGSSSSSSSNSNSSPTPGHSTGFPSSKLLVVLDMDECMIHSLFEGEGGYDVRQNEYRPGEVAQQAAEELADPAHAVTSFPLTMHDGSTARVYKRPGLDDFLRACTAEFDTYVFTAGVEMYASPLLDQLERDAGVSFRGRFYRRSCRRVRDLYLKDLSMVVETVNRDEADRAEGGAAVMASLARTVLVDNNPASFIAQPSNGIPVSNFYGKPEEPIWPALMNLLRQLDAEPDVQPVLEELLGKDYMTEMSMTRERLMGTPPRTRVTTAAAGSSQANAGAEAGTSKL